MTPPPAPGRAAAGPGVASPCTGVCRLDARSGWCVGCGRSLDEIAAWGAASDDEKRRVLARLSARRAAAAARDKERL